MQNNELDSVIVPKPVKPKTVFNTGRFTVLS
jgi:hypothetical protein